MPPNNNQLSREQSQLIFQKGLGLLQQGNFEQADKLFNQAHQLDKGNVDVLNLLGIRAYQKQDYQIALEFLNQANNIYPNSAQTLCNLGLVHHALTQYSDALQYFNLALSIDANVPEIHNNRGNTLKELHRYSEALGTYEKAISLRPNYAEALSNQGVIYLEEGDAEHAINLFQKSIQANENFAPAFNNLGNALTQIENYENAFQCFERALQINPGYLDACLNFGNCLKKAKQFTAAVDCYQHALKIHPNHAKTFYLLGEIYYDIGDCDLSKTYYAKSIELNQGDKEAQVALAIAQIPKVYKSAEDEKEALTNFARQLDYLSSERCTNTLVDEKIIARHPFYLAYQDHNNEPLISQFGSLCADYAKSIQSKLIPNQKVARTSSKIRIGIVSHFICNHPVWHAITKGWVSHLNSDQFELFIFNTNGVEDNETVLAKAKSADYLNCGTNISRAAQSILNHDLDVILYPEIGMDVTTKALACLRLAPIQVASWGHPETTGLPTMDYYLSSKLMEPNKSNHFYREDLVTLPNLGTYFEYKPTEAITPNLENLGIISTCSIMLCAGSPSKYSPIHDAIFIEIAKKLGTCQFVFFNFDENLTGILRERLYQAFADADLDASQFLRFIPFLNKQEFHGLMRRSDLYLDTIGFSGFNTAIQAIECELPIVTIEGSKMRGRLASALLYAMDLQEMVCDTDLAYIDLVVKLSQNTELRKAYKTKIAKSKMLLFNDLAPIKSLEEFLLQKITR